MGGLKHRIARLMALSGKSGEAVILDTLPGMTAEEALRLWFGPDRASWPPSGAARILCVNGLTLCDPLQRLDDIPEDFMEQRDALLFDSMWKRLCDVFDDYRRQVQGSHGTGLMERTTDAGDYTALYRPTEIPFEAPASSTPTEPQDPTMRTDLSASTSAAAIVAAFPRGPRIAFAPETGAGSGRNPKSLSPDARMIDGVMVNPTKKDTVRNDAAEPAPEGDKLDRILSALQTLSDNQTAITARLDAVEKGKEGATKELDDLTAAEKETLAKADGADLSMIEREVGAIKGRMTYVERQRAEMAKEDALAKIQSRADTAANLHGRRAPAPMTGETLDAYKVRVLKEHQKFSPAYKAVDLGVIARTEPVAFAAIEDQIFADSAEASKRPAGVAGELLERTRKDPFTKRDMTEFFGPQTFIKELRPPVMQYVKRFNVREPHHA